MGRKLIYNVKENPKEYFKNYFAENKEMVQCKCGSVIDKFSMRKHLKTKKHSQVCEMLDKLGHIKKYDENAENTSS